MRHTTGKASRQQTTETATLRHTTGNADRLRTTGTSGNRRLAATLGVVIALILSLGLTGCGAPAGADLPGATAQPAASEQAEPSASATPAVSSESVPSQEASAAAEPAASADASPAAPAEIVAKPTSDRAGNPIVVPETVARIVSLAPSFTEMLLDMGLGERIVAIDMNAVGLAGVNPDWPVFDMMAPDTEKLLALAPDVLLASPISTGGGEDPFKLLRDAGVCVIYVPTSSSIADIKTDLQFVGAVVGEPEKAQALVDGMQAELDAIGAIGATVTEKKRVHFEISAAPYIYSFGDGVFLDEMLTLIGAENVYADQESWIPVADEVALAADPDVILTNVNYIPDAIGEIKARPGWDEVKAVKNGDVYQIDNMASSLPNHNIVKALREMAEAIYPELY